MESKTFIYHLDTIDDFAIELQGYFNSKIVLFNGDMGAGKTTLIKALVKSMGSSDIVTSPTFSIVNEYNLPKDIIYHFDFYRIEDIEEAYNFGVEDYLFSNKWLFIEWPERILSLIPENACVVDIKTDSKTKRTLKLTIKTNSLTEIKAYEQLK
ncbi:MAG: tRNA (adenosine(37)-N6)-threonylcarbamoyltransferase complex ATPase subunit type 1 TsaE [Winogradskyella sp.]|uniref:tRNA (adenosine(37)-N6)-threonylcarbamoyltransferase complex ATPase subunit type 1 TsaE n=1 Tax=Winogradskyella sp. TaxID=1883156 RepID=UPI0017A0E5BE|nr:tRNA (adenosine(37)-N6)-threonylcarbamoyltransferase complex ATPase subunit type 1 TsaE [Winogradskyella sp.]MBT8244775.1 tRNA (adenosine(37)-N6)-threonylcarbamoyltransferase complex ATPase subunit type 1 TsaE [Winogradskyella sp.]NNK22901.1 tRNA (adenosine(37)-N6)-threonylcarbamoyltransferase complex ATPase subunit type 1 TsaE [Winogradskyella sp.]